MLNVASPYAETKPGMGPERRNEESSGENLFRYPTTQTVRGEKRAAVSKKVRRLDFENSETDGRQD